MRRRWSQFLLKSTQCKDKRPQVRVVTQDVLIRYYEKKSEGGQTLGWEPREAARFPFLEILKT